MPGGIAQLVEHMLCKHGVRSSNLLISTRCNHIAGAARKCGIFVYVAGRQALALVRLDA